MSQRDVLEQGRAAAVALLAVMLRDHDAMVAASGDSNADDEHDPEGATIAFERAQLDASIADTRRHVLEFDAALARIDDGTYGICTVCGMPIPAARLAVRPSATTDVQHAPR